VHPAGRHASSGRLEDLARDILKRGGYGSVEVSYCQDGTPSLEEAIQRATIHGAQQIVVTPIPSALLHDSACECLVTPWLEDLRQRVTRVQSGYPDIQIIYAAPPYNHERLVDLVLSKIRESESATLKVGVCNLNDLASGETALVQAIAGGAHFRSRMASLGFTPGTLVKMLQNYGHGAVIVSLRGTRVALGRGEARKVDVSRDSGH
jgi:ferrous iron transport protein A